MPESIKDGIQSLGIRRRARGKRAGRGEQHRILVIISARDATPKSEHCIPPCYEGLPALRPNTGDFMNEDGGHLTTTNPSTTSPGVLAASADNDIQSNLIRLKIARDAIIKDCPVNFATLNNKIEDVSTLMADQNLHVLALTETWREDSECAPIKRLRCMGLNVLEAARPIKSQTSRNSVKFTKHSGIVVVSKQGFALTQIKLKFKTMTFEYICVKVYSKGSSQMLAVIY